MVLVTNFNSVLVCFALASIGHTISEYYEYHNGRKERYNTADVFLKEFGVVSMSIAYFFSLVVPFGVNF